MVPLKYFGGKHYLADHIVSLFPVHQHYVEPFFGSGAVLFAKPNNLVIDHSEVINDIYYELTRFYCVLQNDRWFEQFRRVIEVTPLSQVEFNFSAADTDDVVLSAVRFFIRFRQSRQGLGKVFATLSKSRTRRGMNEQVSSWLSAVDCLPEAHARLKRVVIFCDNAINVIRKEDSKHTFFYLDPPYLHETRSVTNAYSHEMTALQHQELLTTLGFLEGKFILSGYNNQLYDGYAHVYGWKREDIPIDNKASSSHEMKIESLWRNY